MVAIALETLLGGTRGEEAGPEALRLVGMGKEVLGLVRPALKTLMKGIQVTASRRVEDIELGASCLAFVDIPKVGIF